MKLLFSNASRIVWRNLSEQPVLLAFDFDGTLAKLVREPGKAGLSPKTRRLLQELSRLVPIAIITGRSVKDLQKRLLLEIPHIVGNHGLEGISGTQAVLARSKKHSSAWKHAFLRSSLPTGVELEDKTYSLAIHYRLSRNKKATREQLLKLISTLKPRPRVVAGKSIFNLVEATAPHKGSALLHIMQKMKAKKALFVGDDDTDEDAFALRNKKIVSVRVGKKKTSKAEYYIAHQSDMNRLLKQLIALYQPRKSPKT